MGSKLTLSTRALVTLADKALERNLKKGHTTDCEKEFFEEYGVMDKFPDAIIVDMSERTESRFDGSYFYTPHAITAWLSHESATHIFLQTPNAVFAFVIDKDDVAHAVVL